MFWGAFQSTNRTSLTVLPGDPDSAKGGITARVYPDLMKEQLPTIAQPGSIFMQDNAPIHKARLVHDWLSNFARENGLRILDWPPHSPNLNRIENLWKLLKDGIVKYHSELL